MIGAVRGAPDPGRPPYLSHFALREPPFDPSADSRFFYADPARQQCLNMLLHLAQYSEEWLLVSGEAGVGKSALLAEFLARADEHVRPCRIDGAKATDGGQLFLQIARCFGVDLARGSDNPLEALRQHLNSLHTEQVPVVTVDDADRLSEDALEIVLRLADLEGDHAKLVRVVLFGTPGLPRRLDAERFSGLSRPHVMELRPLDAGHTGLYLAHRLSIAGYEGPNPFDAKAVRQVHREAGGLPARINGSADQFLREKMAMEKGNGATTWTRRVAIPLVALAAVGGLGLVLQEKMGGFFGSPLSANESQPPALIPPPAKAKVTPLPPATDQTSLAARPLVLREGESVQVSCSPLEKGQNQSTGPAEAPAAHANTPATAGAETPPAPIVTPPPAAATEAPKEKTASVPAPTTAPAPAKVNTSPAAPARGGITWLKTQRPEYFTLQLLAANHDATARAFLKTHRLKGPYALVDTTRNNTPLQVLIYGSFPTKQAASAAARGFQGTQAWPRQFKEFQADLTAEMSAETPTATAPAGASAEVKDLGWIWSRDPRHFTLQLAAAGQEHSLRKQLEGEPLTGPAVVLPAQHEGKPWYLLYYGDFATREAALAALAALPARLRQGEPWVRDFGALHTMLGPAKAPSP